MGMDECIGRKTLLKLLCDACENEYCKAQKTKRGTDYSECVDFDIIRSARAVDAVPVVRCRDCKYRFRNNGHDKNGCPITDADIWMDDNSFCSYGERKEGAE